MGARRYVRSGGNTIIHTTPVGLSIKRRSRGKGLVGIAAVSGVKNITTALHQHVEPVVIRSMLVSRDVSSFLRESERLLSCENRGVVGEIHVWIVSGFVDLAVSGINRSGEGYTHFHVWPKHGVSVNNIPELDYIVLNLNRFRCNCLHSL